jgi:copper chaperone CopZ
MRNGFKSLGSATIVLGLCADPVLAQLDHHMHDGHNHEQHNMEIGKAATSAALIRTPEIDAALAKGGEPVVVDVLGVVCDFCAKAMNKTFGKRSEVAAVYVDLDTKTLNLVMDAGQSLSNEQIDRLVENAGYKLAAIRRGPDALNTGR